MQQHSCSMGAVLQEVLGHNATAQPCNRCWDATIAGLQCYSTATQWDAVVVGALQQRGHAMGARCNRCCNDNTHLCNNFWGVMDAGCSEYWGAMSTGCYWYWDAMGVGVQGVLGCSGCCAAMGTGVQRVPCCNDTEHPCNNFWCATAAGMQQVP